ncbi:uncharacterized protein [Rutidosis leptorrhynchoides]|uniref:uncharacterized protein n=1 Tax=Rutidosis leptorrhynchoides TaxID=125765 RepID=UPI003A990EAB
MDGCVVIFSVFSTITESGKSQKHILRGRRDILPTHLLDKRHRFEMMNDETSKLCSQVISDVEVIVSRLEKNPQQLTEFAEIVKKKKEEVLVENANQPSNQFAEKNTEEEICVLLDVTIPDEIRARPPTNINNKGSRRKRMVGQDEKYVNKRKRKFRECKKCGELQDKHDSRNCDKIQAMKLKEQKLQEQKRKGQNMKFKKKKLKSKQRT